jgi:hypothetical protein
MLDRDEGSEVPHASTNVRLSPQYFDGEKLVGIGLAQQLGWTTPVWDTFMFYPPGARWTDRGLPAPERAIAQQGGVVVGMLDTLPAVPDQSRLLPELRGKAVVVGEQSDFAALLRRVAEPFAARYGHGP